LQEGSREKFLFFLGAQTMSAQQFTDTLYNKKKGNNLVAQVEVQA